MPRMGDLATEDSYDPFAAEQFVNPAVKAVMGGLADTVKVPGQMMAPNPYPLGSEEAAFYDASKTAKAVDWAPGMALNTMGTGAIAGVPVKGGDIALGAGAVRPKMGAAADLATYPASTGSHNPLANVEATFQGKQPSTLTPEEWHAWGQEHGVENLGPLSPLQTYKDMQGRDFQVPGGTEGNWTYYDLLHMKANPINPANVDRELHGEMQRKLGRTMTPAPLDDAQVWNGLTFGMTSPNNPLFPNQVTASRLRLRDPQMLDDLSSMIPWKAGDEVTTQQRKVVNDAIANRFSLDAAGKGGLGTRGTADYSRIGELAQMFKQNPDFFRKAPGEDWGQAVERISSQVPGLSMKTGSFGTVWQDPAHAAISAIDRHMARALEERGGLFETPAARTDWENRGVGLWNKRNPDNPVTSWSDLMTKSGSDGFVGEMLLSHVGAAENPLFRVKGGGVNPNIPQHLAQADWVREPDKVFKMGAAYKRALEENQKLADASGLNLFMSQWLEWDRIRNRFEPHENMFPGLSKMPALSVEQMRLVDDAHRATGHKTYTKTPEGLLPPTRPLGMNPSAMGYLGVGGAAAAPVLGSILNDQEYRQ